MFQKGERIVYDSLGVCEVEDIKLFQFAEMEEKQYYVLRPLDLTGEILIPADTSVFMRPIMTQQEAERLIDQIPTIQADPYLCSEQTKLNQYYSDVIHSHNCADLVTLVMSVFAKRRIRADRNQKAGLIDENYFKRAENLLNNELSVVLGIPRDEVPAYIAASVNRCRKEKKHEFDARASRA